MAGDDAIARFQREAHAAASLNHPNIVSIYEVGQFEGHHYFVMEYVPGPTLAALVRDGPLTERRAATYVREISEAVDCAHRRGVLHRDLKPSNILLDELDRPRITDFGLPKWLDVPGDVTLAGQILGTPAFSAPEQISKSRAECGPRTDVYGLGAILYHLITGRPPFTGESATEILAQVLNAESIAPGLLRADLSSRPGDDRPQMPAKGGSAPLWNRARTGGGFGLVPGGKADSRAANRSTRA